jgi:hypothetical protein
VSLFGSAQSLTPGTTYTAGTDGLVVGSVTSGVLQGNTGNITLSATGPAGSFTLPVQKGARFRLTQVLGSSSSVFIPLGTVPAS